MLKTLLRKIICAHDWKTVHEKILDPPQKDRDSFGHIIETSFGRHPNAYTYLVVIQCVKCGKVSKVETFVG